MTTTPTTADLARTYFEAWNAEDADALRTVLAPDVTFAGPMGTATGPDECIAGLFGMRKGFLDRVEVDHVFTDGSEALTWTFMHTRLEGVDSFPVANRMHTADGRIATIRVTFDPRPLLG